MGCRREGFMRIARYLCPGGIDLRPNPEPFLTKVVVNLGELAYHKLLRV